MHPSDRTERILNKDRPYTDKERMAWQQGFDTGMSLMLLLIAIAALIATAWFNYASIDFCHI